jgi:ATP-dependent helicase/nuclease subunit B
MPAIGFDLGNGRRLLLIGRIDRVDMCAEEGRRYLRIMDYKTGVNDLDEDMIRRGLQLQLITYMEALLNAGADRLDLLAGGNAESLSGEQGRLTGEDMQEERIIPSAMLYYRMTDPVINMTAAEVMDSAGADVIPDQAIDDDRIGKIRSSLRPTGLVLEDEESICHLDKYFNRKSDVIPVTRSTKGGYTSASHLIDEHKYRELADMARQALCRVAEHILDGDVSAQPASLKKGASACDYCPYKGACGFDPRIPGYSYRKD